GLGQHLRVPGGGLRHAQPGGHLHPPHAPLCHSGACVGRLVPAPATTALRVPLARRWRLRHRLLLVRLLGGALPHRPPLAHPEKTPSESPSVRFHTARADGWYSFSRERE